MDPNRRRFCSLLLIPVIALLPLPARAAEEGLTIQRSAHFSDKLNIPEAVRTDCLLETKVVDFVGSFAEERFGKVRLVESASASTPGKSLVLMITDLSGEGGGAWSGPKHLTIEGTLWQNGKIIGTFTATRLANSGAPGVYKGTCSLLGRCAQSLGRDIAAWLENPSMNARLGDVR